MLGLIEEDKASADETQGRNVGAREILDRGADRITRELGAQPLVQGRVLTTLGSLYHGIGAIDRAGS